MILPWLEGHKHPGPGQLIAMAFEGLAGHGIGEPPRLATHILPWYADEGLGRRRRKIDHDQLAVVAVFPAPGQDVQVARVVRPAGALAEPPLAVSEDFGLRLGQ